MNETAGTRGSYTRKTEGDKGMQSRVSYTLSTPNKTGAMVLVGTIHHVNVARRSQKVYCTVFKDHAVLWVKDMSIRPILVWYEMCELLDIVTEKLS